MVMVQTVQCKTKKRKTPIDLKQDCKSKLVMIIINKPELSSVKLLR